MGALLGGSLDLSQLGSTGNAGQGVLAMSFDNNTNLYYATNQGFGVSGIWFVNLATGAAPSLNVNVGYQLSGIAADSLHGRLYISNASTNTIDGLQHVDLAADWHNSVVVQRARPRPLVN